MSELADCHIPSLEKCNIMNKHIRIIAIIINTIGILCLIYILIPYLSHDTTVRNPNAMLPAEAWDEAGMTLTIGLFPMIIANTFGFLTTKSKSLAIKILWYVPSLICVLTVISYWLA